MSANGYDDHDESEDVPPVGVYTPEMAKLDQFWIEQEAMIEAIDTELADFKSHDLPLARIKKIMKLDEEVQVLDNNAAARFMISSEAPVILAKACELFIKELTLKAGMNTQENKRRTLQRHDIIAAVGPTDTYDFLIDIIPREEAKQPKDAQAAQMASLYAQQQAFIQQFAMGMGVGPDGTQGELTDQQYQQQQQMAQILQALACNPQLAMQMQQAQAVWQQQMMQITAAAGGNGEGVDMNMMQAMNMNMMGAMGMMQQGGEGGDMGAGDNQDQQFGGDEEQEGDQLDDNAQQEDQNAEDGQS